MLPSLRNNLGVGGVYVFFAVSTVVIGDHLSGGARERGEVPGAVEKMLDRGKME